MSGFRITKWILVGTEIRVSFDDIRDGDHELAVGRIFRQIACSAGIERAAAELIRRVHAENQHRQSRIELADTFQDLHPAAVR